MLMLTQYFSMYKGQLTGWMKKEEGQGMVEYVLLVALIAIVVIAALVLLGPAIAAMFNNVTDEL